VTDHAKTGVSFVYIGLKEIEEDVEAGWTHFLSQCQDLWKGQYSEMSEDKEQERVDSGISGCKG